MLEDKQASQRPPVPLVWHQLTAPDTGASRQGQARDPSERGQPDLRQPGLDLRLIALPSPALLRRR